MIIWEQIGDWVEANWDKPMFQFVQGLILGLVIALVAVMIVKGLRGEADNGREDRVQDDVQQQHGV